MGAIIICKGNLFRLFFWPPFLGVIFGPHFWRENWPHYLRQRRPKKGTQTPQNRHPNLVPRQAPKMSPESGGSRQQTHTSTRARAHHPTPSTKPPGKGAPPSPLQSADLPRYLGICEACPCWQLPVHCAPHPRHLRAPWAGGCREAPPIPQPKGPKKQPTHPHQHPPRTPHPHQYCPAGPAGQRRPPKAKAGRKDDRWSQLKQKGRPDSS